MAHPVTPEEILVRADSVAQLFKTFDPTPFPGRDLDPDLVEHVVGWAREAARPAALAIRVELPAAEAARPEARVIPEDFARYFADRAEAKRRELREMFRLGRISLAIGLAALAATLAASQFAAPLLPTPGLRRLAEESLIVLGWVVLWRPLDVYLYDWWPLWRDGRLLRRLAAAEVVVAARAESAR